MVNRWVCLVGGMAALAFALLLGCRGQTDRQRERQTSAMGDVEMNVSVGGNQVTMQLVANANKGVEIVDMGYRAPAEDSHEPPTPLLLVEDSRDAATVGPRGRVTIVTWHYTAFSTPVGGYVPPVTVSVEGFVTFRAANGTTETIIMGPKTVQIEQ